MLEEEDGSDAEDEGGAVEGVVEAFCWSQCKVGILYEEKKQVDGDSIEGSRHAGQNERGNLQLPEHLPPPLPLRGMDVRS